MVNVRLSLDLSFPTCKSKTLDFLAEVISSSHILRLSGLLVFVFNPELGSGHLLRWLSLVTHSSVVAQPLNLSPRVKNRDCHPLFLHWSCHSGKHSDTDRKFASREAWWVLLAGADSVLAKPRQVGLRAGLSLCPEIPSADFLLTNWTLHLCRGKGVCAHSLGSFRPQKQITFPSFSGSKPVSPP